MKRTSSRVTPDPNPPSTRVDQMSGEQGERPPNHAGDLEPLLGRPGDATQREDKGLQHNLIIGTAVVAQAGIWILAATVWAAIFESDLILFSAHPLLNSAGVLLATQAILILQPTHTATQKRHGTAAHALLNGCAFLALVAGLVIILYNKIAHNGTHFESPHAILGLTTYILVVIQATVGFTQYYTPSLYGGVSNAKKVYKYHRMAGYAGLVMFLATVCAAADTDFNRNVLGMRMWVLIVASLLVLAGVLPRVRLSKFGLRK